MTKRNWFLGSALAVLAIPLSIASARAAFLTPEVGR